MSGNDVECERNGWDSLLGPSSSFLDCPLLRVPSIIRNSQALERKGQSPRWLSRSHGNKEKAGGRDDRSSSSPEEVSTGRGAIQLPLGKIEAEARIPGSFAGQFPRRMHLNRLSIRKKFLASMFSPSSPLSHPSRPYFEYALATLRFLDAKFLRHSGPRPQTSLYYSTSHRKPMDEDGPKRR
ncbi:hypothetical protein KM043_005154 [Ampulex compressa]|nr:hypothetical protein KM043_005154 [Ampulex compressa]